MAKKQKYKDPEFKNVKRFNTRLNNSDMPLFNEWANTPNERGSLPINDIGAYDIQGYWKDNIRNGINPNDSRGHGPDKYKKPNHPTFSNESQYSNLLHRGVKWESDGGFSPTRRLKKLYTKEYYNRMFDSEPGSPEHLEKYKYGGNVMGCKTKSLKRRKLMAGGGDPKKPKAGTAYSVIANNVLHPLTDLNVADEIIRRGWGTNRDSIMSLTPEARQSMIPKGSDILIDKRKKAPFGTANEGGYKYSQSIPKVTGRVLQTKDKTINNPTADVLSEYGYDDEYSFGGWLKGNIGNIAKTGIGALMTATGVGAPIGASMMASGASGMIGSIGSGMGDENDPNQNEISQVYKPAVSKSNQLYDTTVAANGGNLKRLSGRTDYKGQSHANGGINIGIAEVEDGESRTGDIVHSEKIKITPAIMKAYGGKVPFKKGDLGKSVSSLVKRSDKRFEKRSGDEWNDQARKVSQLPFEEMSDELSQIYEIAQGMNQEMMQGGGNVKKKKQSFTSAYNEARNLGADTFEFDGKEYNTLMYGKPQEYKDKIAREGYWNPDSISPKIRQKYGYQSEVIPGKEFRKQGYSLSNINELEANDWYIGKHGIGRAEGWEGNFPKIPKMKGESADETAIMLNNFYHPLNDSTYQFAGENVTVPSGKTKLPKILSDPATQIFGLFPSGDKKDIGGLLNKGKDFLNDPGNAPIVGSALGLITNTLRKPEKVKYDQAKFTPTNFTPMNTEAGIGAIKRSFGDTKERLRRLNPRGYMNQLANLGAAEAETIGDSVSKIGLGNTQGMNQASMMDSQNRSRLGMFNTQVAMQEAEANAANRGMRKTAIDANMNNLFTQIGQKSKDDKMMDAQKNYQDQMFELQKGYQKIWGDSKKNMDFSFPGDDIMNPYNPIEEDPDKMYSKFGGNILPKTTALLGKRRYRTY